MKIVAKSKIHLYDLTQSHYFDKEDVIANAKRDLMEGMVSEIEKGNFIEVQVRENHMEGTRDFTAITHVYSQEQFNKMCQAVSQLWFSAPEHRALLSLFLSVLGAEQPGKVEIKTE